MKLRQATRCQAPLVPGTQFGTQSAKRAQHDRSRPSMAEAVTVPSLVALPGIRHGFFTRRGGVSAGLYASLNCGPGSGDDPAKVAENRELVTLALKAAHLLTVWQVHSATAIAVTGPWAGTTRPRPQADAMVTATPGLALGALTADCAPVLFYDSKARVIGAAHAGWKGALGGILESTLTAMEALGAARANITAAIGPCIGRAAYEVGEEFAQAFVNTDATYARFFHRPNSGAKPHFDLPAFTAHRLRAASTGQIADIARCTYASESDFFSYRRSTHQGIPDYGRQISAIVLE